MPPHRIVLKNWTLYKSCELQYKKKPTNLCDFICHWTLALSVISVTQEQIPLIPLTVDGNKEQVMGELSPLQLFNQSGHVRLMDSLFCGGPRVKFKLKKKGGD